MAGCKHPVQSNGMERLQVLHCDNFTCSRDENSCVDKKGNHERQADVPGTIKDSLTLAGAVAWVCASLHNCHHQNEPSEYCDRLA